MTPEILDTQRRLADAVNGEIKLSVPWRSVRSPDSGARVCHIQIEAALQCGNFRRRLGDLLCGATLKALKPAEACDGAGRPYSQEINCKACLERAAALNRIVQLPSAKEFIKNYRPFR